MENIIDIIDNIASTHASTIGDLETILSLTKDDEKSNYLFAKANEVRTQYVGDEVYLRAIIEFSSYCNCSCHYCGLRKDNIAIERYRMSANEITEVAFSAMQAGYKSLVLQSGEDYGFKVDDLCEAIKTIKAKDSTMAITISIGEQSLETYKKIKDAGADRYLIKHEIGDYEIYKRIHDNNLLEDRLLAIETLFSLGFQTGGGFLIGLKGQTIHHIASDLLLCRSLNLNMVSIGPFIPHHQTPLKDENHGDLFMVRKAVALARLLQPMALIPATSAYIALTGSIDDLLLSGSNVLMQKASDISKQKMYQIYPRTINENNINQNLDAIKKAITKINRVPSLTRGDFKG